LGGHVRSGPPAALDGLYNGRVSSQPTETAQPLTPFGPFWLERRLAVGGTAEVYVARPKRGLVPAPRLVVKRLLPSLREAGSIDLIEREAELHRAVDHPSVVKVFGAGVVDDEAYLAMEYVDGVDLYRLLRRAESELRPIPPPLAVHITRRIAAALGAVHAARGPDGEPLLIVHRDVTPSNVYLSIDGEVKLGDFGIARVSERVRPPSAAAGLKGKFGYLSPEQIAGEPFDHRADLFALAAILGELLIGERIFPGSGQLAVLLAVRDVNIEPLAARAGSLPAGMFELLQKALARDPGARYPDAAAFSAALEPFELPDAEAQSAELAEWVQWARDSSQLAARLEEQIRDSVQRLRTAKLHNPEPVAGGDGLSHVRRIDGRELAGVSFPKLLEMIATGELGAEDQVALMGAELKPIGQIVELQRHLLPSTSATTGRLFEPGVPDYQSLLRETGMMEVLARMRMARETGALFVERRDRTGAPQRKEIYLSRGRLLHVASSDRAELLGEYLVRRGALRRDQLEQALSKLRDFGGRLGDTLIGLDMVDGVQMFQAIRDQGRDRVAALCGWPRGMVIFYRNTAPAHVQFPLDLDLASPMMAGAIVASRGDPGALLADDHVRIEPGPRHYLAVDHDEKGTAPSSLQLIPHLSPERPSIRRALAEITAPPGTATRGGALRPADARAISLKEACAALVTARQLGWITWPESPGPAD
jgi:eukaryotic-like serine/threonine-protein kinase